MAMSADVMLFSYATVTTATTSVAPDTAVPDNCHTIIFYNPDAAALFYVGFGTVTAQVPVLGSLKVPAARGATVVIRERNLRAGADDMAKLIIDCDTNGKSLDITYVCGIDDDPAGM